MIMHEATVAMIYDSRSSSFLGLYTVTSQFFLVTSNSSMIDAQEKVSCYSATMHRYWAAMAARVHRDNRVKVHQGYYLRAASIALKMGGREATI